MLVIEDFSSKVVNATQPLVERNLEDILCPVDIYNPQPSLEVHQNTDAGISESPDSLLRKSRWVIQGSFLSFHNRRIISYKDYMYRYKFLW